MAFLKDKSDNTWSFVLHMVSAIVNEEGLLFTQSAGRAIVRYKADRVADRADCNNGDRVKCMLIAVSCS